METAFKEWAIVVDALARGEQIFILRKGGIHEGRGGFQPVYPEFLLFPTLFHQQRESVTEGAQARYDQIAPFFPAPGVLRLGFWAELTATYRIENPAGLPALRGQHVWRDEVLAERFKWGRERGIFALVLRVFRLPIALELPMLPEYGGCKSWVQIAHPVATHGSTAVLSDSTFAGKVKSLESALGSVA